MNANGGSEKPPKNAPSDNLSKEDLIDHIAERLPGDMRADYYRLLRHCRSLPENDELLRILNAMQYLTLLIVDVPGVANGGKVKFFELLPSNRNRKGRS